MEKVTRNWKTNIGHFNHIIVLILKFPTSMTIFQVIFSIWLSSFQLERKLLNFSFFQTFLYNYMYPSFQIVLQKLNVDFSSTNSKIFLKGEYKGISDGRRRPFFRVNFMVLGWCCQCLKQRMTHHAWSAT